MHSESLRNTHTINISPDTTGTLRFKLAPAYAGPLTIEVIVDPPKKCVFHQVIEATGTTRFALAPAYTGPLVLIIEVTIDPPKKRVHRQMAETQKTIRTQDIFPDFPDISETEPESSQEDAGAGAASSSDAKTPAVKCLKPE